jgi:hypothetical protein
MNKEEIAEELAEKEFEEQRHDTVLSHWAKYGNEFDEYFNTGKTREQKAIQGEISFLEYTGGVEG